MADLVMIEAIASSDMDMRHAAWTLLEKGLVEGEIDMFDRSRIYLNKRGSQKVGSAGRMIQIFVERERAQEIISTLRKAYYGEMIRIYVLPVLEASL